MTSAWLHDDGMPIDDGFTGGLDDAPRLGALEDPADQTLDALTESFARTVNAKVAVLVQPDGQGRPSAVVSSWGVRPASPLTTRTCDGGFVGRALEARRLILGPLYPLLDRGLVGASRPPLRHAVGAPVRAETGVRAALVGAFATEPADRAWTLWGAESYAGLFGLYLNSPATIEGLLTAARTDTLTGCLTYDSTCRELSREVNRSTRGGLELSCCFIDLDGFKRINDHYGHTRGNEILRRVGRILRKGVRSCDAVGRYGGDEFVAILPQTTHVDALHLSERLRTLIANARLGDVNPPISASVGVATWTTGESAEQLLVRADHELLAAKASADSTMRSSRRS